MDLSKYKATAEKCGHIIVVYVEGDPMCLWLRMYLDCKNGQMTCDSDIGHFACVMPIKEKPFSGWLKNTDWMLRKCVRPLDMEFRRGASEDYLREMAREEGADLDGLESVLLGAEEYDTSADAWETAVLLSANDEGYDLPLEWYDCIIRNYTPHQKRFAEICRDVIAPEVERVMRE